MRLLGSRSDRPRPRERLRVHVRRNLATGQLQHGRRDVAKLHQALLHGRVRSSGRAYQQGDVARRLVERRLALQPVVAQMVAMVGREYDRRIVQEAPCPQRIDYLAHLVVDLLDQPRVVGPGVPHPRLGPAQDIHVHVGPGPGVGRQEPAGVAVRRRDRRRHVPGIELMREVLGRVIGVVRARKPDHQRERTVSLIPIDEPPRLPPGEPVPRVIPRNVRLRRTSSLDIVSVLVPLQLPEAVRFEVVVIIVLDPCPELVLAGHPVLEPVPGVPGVEVHLPDGGREVPGLREDLRPGAYPGLVVVRPQRVQVVGNPVTQSAHARQERGPGGHAKRRRGVGVDIPDPLLSYPVDVGRPDEPSAVTAKEVPAAAGQETERRCWVLWSWACAFRRV